MKSRNSANDMGQNTTPRIALRALMLGSFALVLITTMSLGNAWAASRVQVSAIDVESQETLRTVRIRTGAKPTFTVFKLADPMRVVIDISGGDVSKLDGPIAVEDGVIDQIATRQFSSGGLYVGRVIIGFVDSVFYNVVAEDDAVVLKTGERAVPGVVESRPAPEAPVDPRERERLESLKVEANQVIEKANQKQLEVESNEKAAIATKREAERERAKAAAERENVEQLKQSVRQQAVQALRAQKRAERENAVLKANKQKLAVTAKEVQAKAAKVTAKEQQLTAEKARVAEQTKELKGERVELARKQAATKAQAERVRADARKVEQAKEQAEEVRAKAESEQRLAQAKLEHVKARERAVAEKQEKLVGRAGPSELRGVHRHGNGIEASVLLDVQGRPTLEVERIENPPRLVIDMYETERKTKRSVFGIKSPFVRRVRLGEHDDKLRAVFDLRDSNARHEITRTAEGIVVSMHPSEPEVEKATGGPEVAGTKSLEDVQFTRDGKVARIVLKVALDELPKVDTRSSKAWVLNLENTRVSKSLEKSLDTTAYDTVVRLISTYQANDEPPLVKIVANLEGPAKHRLRRDGDLLIWELTDDSASPVVAHSSAPQTAGFASEAASVARAVPKQTRAKKKKKRISLDLQDAEVVSVLRLLSEVSGENIITSDAVSGTVTLRLRNVPWDQALDTILKTKGFARVRQNNIIRIAPANVIQAEQEAAVARKKLRQESEPTAIKLVTVNYAVASDIVEQLKPLLSERGNVQTDDRTNTIIVEDVVSNIDRVVELTRRLDKQTPQVLIEARIVEASSNELQELGIQWGGVGRATASEGNPTGLVFPGDVTVSGSAGGTGTDDRGVYSPSQYAVNLPATAGSVSGLGFIFGSAGGSQLLALRLTAMEERGSGRIISSPRITTLDNRTARISQGIDIPVSTTSAQGTNTKFVSANLELEVTPHVTNDGSVLMQIKTEKSEPDFRNTGASGDPTLLKKMAETEVLVSDGDTTVIGGIYTRNTSESYEGIPILSDIPILGWLFKRRSERDDRAELLIFITPRIVNRQEALMQASSLSNQPATR